MDLARRIPRRWFLVALHALLGAQLIALRALLLAQAAFFAGVVVLLRAMRNVAMSGDCVGDDGQVTVRPPQVPADSFAAR